MSLRAPDAREQAAALRCALQRKALADAGHRAALARRLGVSQSELLAIEHLNRDSELTTGELAACLHVTPSGAVGVIHRLQRAGRLTAHDHPRNRRSTIHSLAPTTVAWAADAWSPLASEIETLAEAVPHDHRDHIRCFLHAAAVAADYEADRLANETEDIARGSLAVHPPPRWS
jgi:DNA-binding MarR family transcriptional regulator